MSQSTTPVPQGTRPKKRTHVTEKFMGILILVFFVGIFLYATIPAGFVRVLALTGFTVGTTYLLFKFGR
ncbi:MAG: hypothetical protein KTR14_06945 [Vampirovibrio sp.]|nr:hypothetical protein [Vampirovibrio sp.]